jgi:hypothetical protein
MIADGRLKAERIGRLWFVDPDSAERILIQNLKAEDIEYFKAVEKDFFDS